MWTFFVKKGENLQVILAEIRLNHATRAFDDGILRVCRRSRASIRRFAMVSALLNENVIVNQARKKFLKSQSTSVEKRCRLTEFFNRKRNFFQNSFKMSGIKGRANDQGEKTYPRKLRVHGREPAPHTPQSSRSANNASPLLLLSHREKFQSQKWGRKKNTPKGASKDFWFKKCPGAERKGQKTLR